MGREAKKVGGMVGMILCFGLLLSEGSIFAQEKFPAKPITFIVSWSAGGGQDMVVRALEPNFVKAFGQPAIIVNKPGGGSTIGLNEIMKAPPDGYTIGPGSPNLLISRYTVKDAGIDYRKFEPVIYIANSDSAVFAKKDAPWNNLEELLAWTKKNPGKLRVGNSGYGAMQHLSAIAMEHAFKTKVIHVPYKGGAPSLPALMGGHLDVIVNSITDVLHLVKGGELKALGVAAQARNRFLPGVQTFKELGMNVVFSSCYTWVGPKGIAKNRVDTLFECLRKSAESKEFKDFCDQQGVTLAIKGPAEFGKVLDEEDKMWKEVIEIGGIKPE